MGWPVVYPESGILNTSKQGPAGIKTRGALKMHMARESLGGCWVAAVRRGTENSRVLPGLGF